MEGGQLVKTGDFAQICDTTRHTLIHYDLIGILKPKYVAETGYRYYGADEFLRFETIRALVDSGFSLEEVAGLLSSRSPEALEEAVRDQLVSLQEKMSQLERSALKLNEIARQAKRAADASNIPRFEEKENMTCLPAPLSDFLSLDSQALKGAMVQSKTLVKAMAEASPELAFAPICFAVDPATDWKRNPAYNEAFYVLPFNMKKIKGIELRYIESGVFACVDYIGPYNGVYDTRKQLCDFVEGEGKHIVSPLYEMNALSLLDTDFKQDSPYRCTVFARVE